ncbi:Metallophosphoesterase domain-containing protein 1 [Phytophthora nicotianae]|uniref:Metallophosphoesterase domain-containing protein 1 n=1 Tax=Phytophthora nicotianae TaxID=4792 RepID=A0A0W8DGK6_PHYNI|nr:Metallophosphoesterase domain-containing protein 1 [Phytophthora nicotianae]
MGHGKALSEQEHWFIVGLHGGGVSLHEIARKTGRSRTSVPNAIKAERGPKEDSGGERRAGRQPVLTERELRQLVRAAETGEFFASELKTKLGIKASVRTIQRVLQRVDHLVFTKMDRTLPLTAAHKVARMQWAEEYILEPGKLVVFRFCCYFVF